MNKYLKDYLEQIDHHLAVQDGKKEILDEIKSHILEKAARSFTTKTAIVMGERRVSFTELNDAANNVASTLIKMGVAKGDRVAMIQSSNPEFVSVFFGIMRAGGIAVPLDPRYVVAELASLFDDCKPKVLVAEGPVETFPGLGQHTDDVLGSELGLDGDELARLRGIGVI